MKKTWRTINETLSRNKKKCDIPPSFVHNGRTLSNSKEIANVFNSYFANIGANLASEIETQLDNTIDFLQCMGLPAVTRLQFKCVTETVTLKAIDNLLWQVQEDSVFVTISTLSTRPQSMATSI